MHHGTLTRVPELPMSWVLSDVSHHRLDRPIDDPLHCEGVKWGQTHGYGDALTISCTAPFRSIQLHRTLEQPSKGTDQKQHTLTKCHPFQRRAQAFSSSFSQSYGNSQNPYSHRYVATVVNNMGIQAKSETYSAMSSAGRTQWTPGGWNQEWPHLPSLSITHWFVCVCVRECVCACASDTYDSGHLGLVAVVPRRTVLLSGDRASVSLNYKLWLLPGHFGLLVFRNQQVRRGATIWQLFNPDHQEEVVLLLHTGIELGMELR